MGGMAIFVYLVRPVFPVKKIKFVFLFICLCDEIGRIDERDERDLLTEGEDGGGYAVTGPIF